MPCTGHGKTTLPINRKGSPDARAPRHQRASRAAPGTALRFAHAAANRKGHWIAQFVTVLVTETKPSRGLKFSTLIAHREWREHKDEPARDAAFRWIESQANKP